VPKIARYLNDAWKGLQRTPEVIESLVTEYHVAAAQLAFVQQLILKAEKRLATKLRETDSLGDVFPAVLGSLTRIHILTDDEIQQLPTKVAKLSFSAKVKFHWNQSILKWRLENMHRQQSGLDTLMQILQT
jgi:hypothetical protein